MTLLNGVPVRDLFGPLDHKHIELPTVELSRNDAIAGKYAEFMVCAYLTKLGYRVLHIDTIGYDILLEYEGRNFKIDVKITNSSYIGKRKETVYWHVGKHNRIQGKTVERRKAMPYDCDIFALFYLGLDAVGYVPVTKPTKEIAIPISQLRSDPQGELSLKAALAAKLGAR
jgi:hypothetical protein